MAYHETKLDTKRNEFIGLHVA